MVLGLQVASSALWHCTRPSLTENSVPRLWQRSTESVGTPTIFWTEAGVFVNHDWKGLEFDHYPDHQKITLKWRRWKSISTL